MTKLYPIGTQLITQRLSQASLADELDFCVETQVSTGKFYPTFDIGFDNFDRAYDTWIVTVTKDNQELLSPVPMVGDKIQYHTSPYCSDKVTNIVSIDPNDEDILWVKDDPSTDIDPEEHDINVYQITHILRRAYPNGQGAPLIEWDEVILPETEGE
jgi:hypothetical protein